MLVGFVCVSFVTTGSLLNGLAMCMVGVLLGQIGTDVNSGVQRFTMDLPFLLDGVGLVSIALGCFGIAEITKNLDNRDERTPFNGKIKLMPTWPEFKRIIPSALRGSVVGSFLGILPGGGPVIAQFAAYAIDKKVSKYKHEIGTRRHRRRRRPGRRRRSRRAHQLHPADEHRHSGERGDGADDGAPSSSRASSPGPNMIAGAPRPVLGPGGEHVGRQLLPARPQRAAGALLAVGVQDPVQRCCSRRSCSSAASAPTASTTTWTTYLITAAFGFMGYMFLRLALDPAPLMLGFILGPMLEENFRRALLAQPGQLHRLRHTADQRHADRPDRVVRPVESRGFRTRDAGGQARSHRRGRGGARGRLAIPLVR